jgi:hypothetical protein
MNLKLKHVLPMLLGGVLGAAVGWWVSFLVKPGLVPDLEKAFGLQDAGLVVGGMVGVFVAPLVIIARAARDPQAEKPYHFIQLKGTGSTLIGHADPRPDGSYVAMEWFTILWIPFLPLCRHRVIENQDVSFIFHHEYRILEMLPPRPIEYGVTALAVLLILGLLLLWL